MSPADARTAISTHLDHRRALRATRRTLLPAIRTVGREQFGTVAAFTDRIAETTGRPAYTVKNRLYDRPEGPVADDALRLLGFDVPDDGDAAEEIETPVAA